MERKRELHGNSPHWSLGLNGNSSGTAPLQPLDHRNPMGRERGVRRQTIWARSDLEEAERRVDRPRLHE